MIPKKFNSDGVLDPGTYESTIASLRKSILVIGDGSSETWDAQWRLKLVDNLEFLSKQLWQVGVQNLYVNGSFVENKDHPNDIDGYFDLSLTMEVPSDIKNFRQIVSALNDLDPHKVWNWNPASRRPYRGYSKAQLPMWHFYRIELYPHLKQSSGLKDKYGNELTFPSAFRQSRRNFKPKGIIKIVP